MLRPAVIRGAGRIHPKNGRERGQGVRDEPHCVIEEGLDTASRTCRLDHEQVGRVKILRTAPRATVDPSGAVGVASAEAMRLLLAPTRRDRDGRGRAARRSVANPQQRDASEPGPAGLKRTHAAPCASAWSRMSRRRALSTTAPQPLRLRTRRCCRAKAHGPPRRSRGGHAGSATLCRLPRPLVDSCHRLP